MTVSPIALDLVERIMPTCAPGLPPTLLYTRLGGYSLSTVRRACRDLVRCGRAGFHGRLRRRLYFKCMPDPLAGTHPPRPVRRLTPATLTQDTP